MSTGDSSPGGGAETVDKVGFCHCEPVTDVCIFAEAKSGVAIRIPRKPHQIRHPAGERIPTPVLRHWLGMTGLGVCLHIELPPGGAEVLSQLR